MFEHILNTDFFNRTETHAVATVIKNDRMQYAPIFDKIKEYLINDNTIILSNPERIIDYYKNNNSENLQTGMVLYSTHTRRATTIISNIIHENFGKFVQMRAIIPNEEYEILFDMRKIVNIYRINKYKNIELDKLFDTIQLNNNVYFPANIELMDIYHKLYLPNFYSDWPLLIKQEHSLYDIFTKNIIGGKYIGCKKKRRLEISNIKILLMQYLNNENYVMVGNWAHDLIKSNFNKIKKNNTATYLDTDNQQSNPIQIISENSIDMDYKNIVSFLYQYTDYGIFYKKRKMYIPKNNRILKYTLYIKYPTLTSKASNQLPNCSGIDKPFMDIYNCGTYEIIPYEKLTFVSSDQTFSINVGNLYVQLYFLCIDSWIINLLKQLSKIEVDDFNIRKSYIFNTIKYLKKNMPIKYDNMYMGINYDEKISQKIIISENQIKKTSYYPELSIKTDKKYKLIATSSM